MNEKTWNAMTETERRAAAIAMDPSTMGLPIFKKLVDRMVKSEWAGLTQLQRDGLDSLSGVYSQAWSGAQAAPFPAPRPPQPRRAGRLDFLKRLKRRKRSAKGQYPLHLKDVLEYLDMPVAAFTQAQAQDPDLVKSTCEAIQAELSSLEF